MRKIILLNPVKTKIKVNYIQRLSSYSTVNTLRLGYGKKSFNYVFEKNLYLC